jgi:phosphoglycerate dehydrogenase-like enzyme
MPKETAVATKIILSPVLPPALVEIARSLLPADYELCVIDQGTPEFLAAVEDAEYFVGFARSSLGSDFYRAAPKLKLVQLISAGYDRLDLEAARKAGIPVANNGGANALAVAEHTMMLMLAVLKKLAWQHNNVVAGMWRVGDFSETRLYELAGKTLGIVGLGNIGKKVARRARAFEMQVRYYDPVRLSEEQEDALEVRFVLMTELLRTSDVVSLHVPLTVATRNLMSTREFAAMKPTAILINTCRGPVVDEAALHHALTTRQIAGAGLDVLVQEPPPTRHPLFALDNIIITPHMAGPTWENWTRAFRNAFDNIQRVAAGTPPRWVIPELQEMV